MNSLPGWEYNYVWNKKINKTKTELNLSILSHTINKGDAYESKHFASLFPR